MKATARHHTPWTLIALGILAILIFTSCAPAAPTPTTAAPTPTAKGPALPATPKPPVQSVLTPAALPTATPTKAAAAKGPKYGGTYLMWTNYTAPVGWDPAMSNSSSIHELYNIVGGHIISWKEGPGENPGAILMGPDLADKWEVSTDGMKYTFHLRQGIMTQPQNREVTSTDVKFSLDRYTCLGSDKTSKLVSVKNVDAPDKYTLVINMNEPDADMLLGIAGHEVQIFYQDALTKSAKSGCYEATGWDNLAGYGPFLRGEYKFGISWTLVKNPNYYMKGLPYLDAIKWVVMPDAATRLASVRTDGITEAAPSCKQAQTMEKSNPEIQLRGSLYMGATSPLRFNVRKQPFDDVRVRQALSMAIDRDSALQSLVCGKGVSKIIGVPPGQADWFLPIDKAGDGAKNYAYSPDAAKKLLADAGFTAGKLSIAITNGYPPPANDFVELVAGYWTTIGVPTKSDSRDYQAFINTVALADTQVKQYSFGRPDIQSYTWDMYHPSFKKAADVLPFIPPEMDPQLTKMIEQQRSEVDFTKRQALLADLQKYLAVKVYAIFAPSGYTYFALRPYVRDWNQMATGWERGHYKYVWFDK